MSKKNIAEIVCILDRSGSMYDLTDDTIGGFNQFIKEQRKVAGKARVSLVLFNHEYKLVYGDKPLKKVEKLTRKLYQADGMTALLDAVGRTIEDVWKRQKVNGKPDKTVVCIITDGYENSSKDYTRDRLRELIGKYQKKEWAFFFLGANIDSFAAAGGIGISAGHTVNYAATKEGTAQAYVMANLAVTSSRTGDDSSEDWKSETISTS